MTIKKTVVVGVTGGIAAFKTIDLVKALRGSGYEVIVIMTENATKIIRPDEFEAASGNKVYYELFEEGFDYKVILENRKVDHIEIADKADILVIAPATANIIAKIAHGFADDFLTTTILATKAQVIICPAMNVNMWSNMTMKENLEKIRMQGYLIVEPGSGMLACGYEGKGRLADLDLINSEINRQMHKREELGI
jgi:phosphopantothenoylcysteine decarboxylase/phosphopantothenate--cysteine ligase